AGGRRRVVPAVIAHRGTATARRLRAHAAARAPAALDPDVAVTAALPATLHPDVAGALALPVAVAPHPAVTGAHPAPLDPDEAGTRVDHDDARRRRRFVDLDVRDGGRNAAVGANHAAGGRQRSGDD